MFERFTASARRMVVLSQGEARALKHDHVDPSHLFLGVLTAEDATAAALHAPLGVEREAVRAVVVARHSAGENERSGHWPWTTPIFAPNTFLGLLSGPSREVGEILTALGVSSEAAREVVMSRLGSPAGVEPIEP